MGSDRDYYADLELPPTADIPEIKKQFRKLALKYHPDRNPGRETEVNAQFQIIQSAHEILGDPQSKAKYDASLPRSRYPAASGVRGNPWANAGDQFPPPPRRTQGGPRRTQPPPPTPTGAQRWQSRFASGTAPTAKQTPANDPQLKKNAAKAFEHMRKNPGASGASPTRPRPMSSQPPPMPPRNEPPRTESARQRREASFGTRRTGYQPGDKSGEDEPPVSRHSYSSAAKPPRPPKEPVDHAQEYPTPMPDPLAQFREPTSPLDPRPSMPYAKLGGEKTDPCVGTGPTRAKSAREPGHRTDQSSSDDRPSSRQNLNRSSSLPRTAESDRLGDDLGAGGSLPNSSEAATDRFDRSSFKSRSSAANAVAGGSKSADETSSTAKDDPQRPSIFTMPVDGSTFRNISPEPKPFTRRSTDEINTSFVEDDDSQHWQFSAGGERPRAQPKRRINPEGNGSAAKNAFTSQNETDQKQSQAAQPDSAFNPGGWNDQFGPQTFVPQRDQTSSASPTRTNRKNSRRTKTAAKGGSAAAAIIIDSSSDDESGVPWQGRKPQADGGIGSPQAMDLDSPPAKPTDPPPPVNVARNIPVEPTRPEWRHGNAEVSHGEVKADTAPKEDIGLPARGSEDTEEFRASFSDFRNVAPFANPASGLKSFDDLKDNLPFESKASNEAPMTLPSVQPLMFPRPPVAPRPPPTAAISGMKPTMASWTRYLEDFEKYLRAWDDWNANVSDHFRERKRLIRDSRTNKGYSFLGIRGDSDVLEYYSWVQQDNDVRRRWCTACEEHEQRMREFIAFREKMK